MNVGQESEWLPEAVIGGFVSGSYHCRYGQFVVGSGQSSFSVKVRSTAIPLAFHPLDFSLHDLTDELRAPVGTQKIIDAFRQALRQANNGGFHSEWWSSHNGVVTAHGALSIQS